eukprot:2509311-Pyramimonas_sp.AAC.1
MNQSGTCLSNHRNANVNESAVKVVSGGRCDANSYCCANNGVKGSANNTWDAYVLQVEAWYG